MDPSIFGVLNPVPTLEVLRGGVCLTVYAQSLLKLMQGILQYGRGQDCKEHVK